MARRTPNLSLISIFLLLYLMQAKDERAKEKLTLLFIRKHLQEKSPQKQFAGCAAQISQPECLSKAPSRFSPEKNGTALLPHRFSCSK
ncbi:MAG: hypothetical protein KH202_03530 [Clostridiales bacterium]|nr:hypothetical protein [Clostridiales bacterium]